MLRQAVPLRQPEQAARLSGFTRNSSTSQPLDARATRPSIVLGRLNKEELAESTASQAVSFLVEAAEESEDPNSVARMIEAGSAITATANRELQNALAARDALEQEREELRATAAEAAHRAEQADDSRCAMAKEMSKLKEIAAAASAQLERVIEGQQSRTELEREARESRKAAANADVLILSLLDVKIQLEAKLRDSEMEVSNLRDSAIATTVRLQEVASLKQELTKLQARADDSDDRAAKALEANALLQAKCSEERTAKQALETEMSCLRNSAAAHAASLKSEAEVKISEAIKARETAEKELSKLRIDAAESQARAVEALEANALLDARVAEGGAAKRIVEAQLQDALSKFQGAEQEVSKLRSTAARLEAIAESKLSEAIKGKDVAEKQLSTLRCDAAEAHARAVKAIAEASAAKNDVLKALEANALLEARVAEEVAAKRAALAEVTELREALSKLQASTQLCDPVSKSSGTEVQAAQPPKKMRRSEKLLQKELPKEAVPLMRPRPPESPVEIVISADKGRILYAKQACKAKSIIFEEAPFFEVVFDELSEEARPIITSIDGPLPSKSWYVALKLLHTGGSLCSKMLERHCPEPTASAKIKAQEILARFPINRACDKGKVSPAVLLAKLASAVYFNAFEYSDSNKPEGNVIFEMLTCISHSCDPNCAVDVIRGDVGRLVALKAIAAKTELTISYLSDEILQTESTARRRKLLMDGWGFFCNCRLCSAGGDQASCSLSSWDVVRNE